MILINVIRDLGHKVRDIRGYTEDLPRLFTKDSKDADYCLVVDIVSSAIDDVNNWDFKVYSVNSYSDFEMENLRYSRGRMSIGIDMSVGTDLKLDCSKVSQCLDFILPDISSRSKHKQSLIDCIYKVCGIVDRENDLCNFIDNMDISVMSIDDLLDTIDSLDCTDIVDSDKYTLGVCSLESSIRQIYKDMRTKLNKTDVDKPDYSGLAKRIHNILTEELRLMGIKSKEKCLVGMYLDGIKPIDLPHCYKRYEDKVYTDFFKPYNEDKKQVDKKCSFCGMVHKAYTILPYSFYTNDKEVYSNNETSSIFTCFECLMDILTAKKFLNEYCSAWWCGSSVWFIPHSLNEYLYDSIVDQPLASGTEQKLLGLIKDREIEFLDELKRHNSLFDIVFYEFDAQNTTYDLKHTISGLHTSRFSKLSDVLKRHSVYINTKDENNKYIKLTTYDILVATGAYIGKSTNLSAKILSSEVIDILLNGKQISKSKLMSMLMYVYISSLKANKKLCLNSNLAKLNKVYCIFHDMGCIDETLNIIDREGEMYRMIKYVSVDDVFYKNRDYFSDDSKKAWFMLGKLYAYTIRKSKEYYNSKAGDSSHLEKNFITNRAFNKKTFIYIANMCLRQLNKYSAYNSYAKSEVSEINSLMESGGRVTESEAAHAFFWGLSIYIEKDNSDTSLVAELENQSTTD